MRSCVLALLGAIVLLSGCKSAPQYVDHPRVTPGVSLRDVVFQSRALDREMRYRVVFPDSIRPGERLPVVYMLHGSGGDLRDWTNYSAAAHFATAKLILVMPQGDDSYYVNAVDPVGNRYEDYMVQDLISDIEAKFPAARSRSSRAIIGISMGGFGAIKIALSHPDLFAFAAGLSAAIDVPRRAFSLKRIQQYRAHSAIFGAWGSPRRRADDPFLIAASADPAATPFLYLACGDQEGLLPANRDFEAVLSRRKIQHEFHVVPGGHNWEQWSRQLPVVFESLLAHLNREM